VAQPRGSGGGTGGVERTHKQQPQQRRQLPLTYVGDAAAGAHAAEIVRRGAGHRLPVGGAGGPAGRSAASRGQTGHAGSMRAIRSRSCLVALNKRGQLARDPCPRTAALHLHVCVPVGQEVVELRAG
jgi:hypothetical protein